MTQHKLPILFNTLNNFSDLNNDNLDNVIPPKRKRNVKEKNIRSEEINVSWYYNEEPVDNQLILQYKGFVYCITDTLTNKKYIGKKFIWTKRKVKGQVRKQTTESNWLSYYGSNEEIKTLVKKDKTRFKRVILYLCKSEGETNWREVEEQFKRDVLHSEEYYNDNIAGRWFKKNVMKYYLSE